MVSGKLCSFFRPYSRSIYNVTEDMQFPSMICNFYLSMQRLTRIKHTQIEKRSLVLKYLF